MTWLISNIAIYDLDVFLFAPGGQPDIEQSSHILRENVYCSKPVPQVKEIGTFSENHSHGNC